MAQAGNRVHVLAALLGVAALDLSARGQSFVRYELTGDNLTHPGEIPVAGDVLRVFVHVGHDGFSYAGGRIDILFDGAAPADVLELVETGGALPPELDPTFDRGRHPLARVAGSDKPEASPFPGDRPVTTRETSGTNYEGRGTAVITDDAPFADGFFDFATTPPGLGGLISAFPIPGGEAILVFDYVFDGRLQYIEVVTAETALLWRDSGDLGGIVVPAVGDRARVVPAPGWAAAAGALLIAQRRRCV